ncbi:hypothetical protein GCM10027341_17970 [Spirosoma knui]
MKDEKDVERDEAQIIGRTEGPFGTDDADADVHLTDNKNRDEIDDSSNGLDSMQVRGGQDGRNNRAFGGIDMDSKNGVMRMGDMDNSTMEVTEEAQKSIVANGDKTNTSTVDVTTHGPDDYASAEEVGTPAAQKEAKEQDADDSEDRSGGDQVDDSEQVAQTGTDTDHEPTY